MPAEFKEGDRVWDPSLGMGTFQGYSLPNGHFVFVEFDRRVNRNGFHYVPKHRVCLSVSAEIINALRTKNR